MLGAVDDGNVFVEEEFLRQKQAEFTKRSIRNIKSLFASSLQDLSVSSLMAKQVLRLAVVNAALALGYRWQMSPQRVGFMCTCILMFHQGIGIHSLADLCIFRVMSLKVSWGQVKQLIRQVCEWVNLQKDLQIGQDSTCTSAMICFHFVSPDWEVSWPEGTDFIEEVLQFIPFLTDALGGFEEHKPSQRLPCSQLNDTRLSK